jgi:endonuclease III
MVLTMNSNQKARPSPEKSLSRLTREKIAGHILEALHSLIPSPKVPLFYQDPFTLLIAVLLSAQCTDERVNNVTPLLFARASTPAEMALLPVEIIQKIIHPCGLAKRKAIAIKKLSEELVKRFHGKVPESLESLESLPGVGHKTASVVLVQAFGIPAFPVDRHIFRSARRWRLSEGKTVQAVERDLCSLFPKESWGKVHLQIILYARSFCPAQKHALDKCPICRWIESRSFDVKKCRKTYFTEY